MKKQIVICSLYYQRNSITATNRIFDELWSRVYKKHKIKLLTIVPKDQCPLWLDRESCVEVSCNLKSIGRLSALRQLNQILEKLDPSIVINDFLPIPFKGLKNHTHVQFICHVYSRRESLLHHVGVTNQVSKMNSKSYVLTISETSKTEIVKRFNFNPNHIIVSYCGISSPLLNSYRLNPEEKHYDFLYVATFSRRKNHLNLIKALSLIDRPISLALLGQDLGYRNRVEALTKKLRLQDSVDFLAPMPESNMAELYRRSHFFVSPSWREGFGMPVAEALAIGLPVACSDIPVFREVAGSLACYFDPYNPSSIASALETLLDSSDAVLYKVKECQEYVREKFSWDNIAGKLVKELKNL